MRIDLVFFFNLVHFFLRMVDYEEKTELLEMLTSGAGLEKLEEVGLEHLEKKLEASLKLVSVCASIFTSLFFS